MRRGVSVEVASLKTPTAQTCGKGKYRVAYVTVCADATHHLLLQYRGAFCSEDRCLKLAEIDMQHPGNMLASQQ